MVVCGDFHCSLLDSRHSLTALNPLFPGTPAPSVVKYVVKEPFSTERGRSAAPGEEGSFQVFGLEYCTFVRAEMQVIFLPLPESRLCLVIGNGTMNSMIISH